MALQFKAGALATARGRFKQLAVDRRRPNVRLYSAASVSTVSSLSEGDGDDEPRIVWYERPSAFTSLSSMAELESALQQDGDKYKVVEFFAGWCGSCKAAFPALCKMPKDVEIKPHYKWYKANIENEEFNQYIKQRQVAGIPHMVIYSKQGKPMIGLSTSFKKVAAVKEGLKFIVKHPAVDRFVLDPTGAVAVP